MMAFSVIILASYTLGAKGRPSVWLEGGALLFHDLILSLRDLPHGPKMTDGTHETLCGIR